MMTLHRDSSSELLRALRKRAGAGVKLTIEDIRSRPWASATFSGARHKLTFRMTGRSDDAPIHFSAGIEAAEFSLRGHIVADIAITGQERLSDNSFRLQVEALTVEDC